jgi:muconate cycloisomerase
MMKIERVEVMVVSLPPRREHPTNTGGGRVPIGRYVLTRILAGGLEGWGEASVLKEWGGDFGRYYGEEPKTTARLIQEVLAPAIIGLDAMAIGPVVDRLDETVKGYPYAKASIDIALHDLVGRATGLPVYRLLGGPYRDRIPIAHSLGVLSDDRVLSEVEAAVSEGCKTIKLKVGLGDTTRDVRIVHEVRRLVGPNIDVTVDANQGWGDAKTAIRTIHAMRDDNVLFVEQPVEGLSEMAKVTRGVDVPVMADESAWNARDVLEIAKLDAADAISIYTTKPGGLHKALKMGAVAEAAGFPCNVNGSHETGVGNAANIHLAAALRMARHASVLTVSGPAENHPTKMVGYMYLDDIVAEPMTYDDGFIVVPDLPGLGFTIDAKKIKRYQQGSTLTVSEGA